METEHQERPHNKGTRFFTILFVLVIVLVILGAITLFQRRSQYQALAKETETLAIPTVAVFHPTTESSEEELVLPGTMQAYVESPIYARTNGYLKKWYHDIGSRVRQGDLLADIDTPEVDQQLSQARADLNTSQANADLSKITATRYEELIKTDGVSKQEVDNAVGDLDAKVATVRSAEANVRRLEELESFKHIYAPFSGVITRRNVDTGTLINAGNGGTSQLLFTLAQTDPTACLCERPGNLCAIDSHRARRVSRTHPISRPEIPGQSSAHGGVYRHRHAHTAYRSGRAESRRRTAPRRICAGASGGKSDRGAAASTRERAAVPLGRTPRGGCGCQSSNAPEAAYDWP